MRRILVSGLAAALVAAAGAGAVAGPRDDAAHRGARYIAERQEPSGTFFSPDWTADLAAEAVVALAAGGLEGEPVDRALGFIREEGPDRADERAGYAGRIAMGIAAADRDPRDFGGVDYVERIRQHYDPGTGRYDSTLYANALALLGLGAGSVEPPQEAIRYVRANQCADGGWGWASGCASAADTDTTAHTLSALLASGVRTEDLAVSRARDWLLRARNGEGGFGHKPGGPTRGNSTGLALSAIAALGEDPTGEPWADEAGDPVDALLALQTGSGGFKNLPDDEGPNDYATVQAVPGAAGAPYPLLPESEATPTATAAPTRGPSSERDDGEPTGPSRTSSPRRPSATDRARVLGRATASPAPDRAEGAENETELHGSGGHRAGVLVRGEDGELRRMCVLFEEPEISGLALLDRAGLDVVSERFSRQGSAICRIGPDGCGSEDCFCGYPTFWGYWTRDGDDDAWSFSEVGAADRTVTDGAMDAWVWGEDGKPPPPDDVAVDDVCPPAAETSDLSMHTPRPTPETSEGDGSVNVPALAGIGALLVGGGAALAIRRWRAG